MNASEAVFAAGKRRLFCRARSISNERDASLHRKAHRKGRRGLRRFGAGAIVLISALLAAGCGQKGPLYLPQDQAQIRSSQVVAVADAMADPASPKKGVLGISFAGLLSAR